MHDVKAALEQILEPFDENARDARHAFWDWYQIGGRWAGSKLLHGLDIDKFIEELSARKVTVSAFQAGKQTLQPASQIEMVDALWRDFFPNSEIKVCPLFDNFKGGDRDVTTLAETPKGLTASRVIIAGPHWDTERGGLEAHYMTLDDMWNGVMHVKSAWDGTLGAALAEHASRNTGKNAEKRTPRDDWLVVTVDYHS